TSMTTIFVDSVATRPSVYWASMWARAEPHAAQKATSAPANVRGFIGESPGPSNRVSPEDRRGAFRMCPPIGPVPQPVGDAKMRKLFANLRQPGPVSQIDKIFTRFDMAVARRQ